jgi:CDP-paratose 2-epimerase
LYNLGGGRENSATLLEIVKKIGELIQLEPVIAEDDTSPHPIPVHYVSDLNRIRQQLDWKPQIGIEEGLRELL